MVINEICRVVKFICCLEFLRMGVLWTLSLVICYLRFFIKRGRGQKISVIPRRPVADISPEKRPVCIITGATSGLGAAAAEALSKEGFLVILVGRSGHLLSKTMVEIRKLNANAQLEAFEVDLSSFSSIMKLKNSLTQWFLDMNLHPSIQLLINNAGVLATSSRVNNDGLDEMMMTNYIGAFCLTKVLLPLLRNSPVPSRIVNVSSFTHRIVTDVQVDDEFISGKSFSSFKQYPFAHIYELSKLCMLLFSYELHQQICKTNASQLSVNYMKGLRARISRGVAIGNKYLLGQSGAGSGRNVVQVISVADPGAVKTNIMRELPQCLSLLAYSVLKLLGILQLPDEGVSSILDAALAPPETSGMYFFGGKGRTIESSSISYNPILANRLWLTSCDIFIELEHMYEKTTTLPSS